METYKKRYIRKTNKNIGLRLKIISVLVIGVLILSMASPMVIASENENKNLFSENKDLSLDPEEEQPENESSEQTNIKKESRPKLLDNNGDSLLSRLKQKLYEILKSFLDHFPRLANISFFQKMLKRLNTSNEDTESPSKVVGLSVTDVHDGKLNLNWDAATDNDSDISHYNIYWSKDGFHNPIDNVNHPTTSYLDTGLTNGHTYSYRVSAVDTEGMEGPKSDSASGTPTKSSGGDNSPPDQVTGLTITSKDRKLELSWDAATDDVGVDHYCVYRDGSHLVDVEQTEYLDTGLVNGVSYEYQVSAVDTEGVEGPKSVSVNATPTETTEDTEPPSKVSGLSVTDVHDGKLDLSWDAASDNVGVDHYCVYRDGDLIEDGLEVTEYLDSGLTNGHTYSYRVSAVDAAGNEGEKSDSVSGTPTESTEDATVMPESGHIAIGGNGYLQVNTTLDINGTLVTLNGTVFLQTGTEFIHIWWNTTTGFFKINATGFTQDDSEEFDLIDFYLKIEDTNNNPSDIITLYFNHFSMDGPGSFMIDRQGQQGEITLNGELKVGEINGQINLNDFKNLTIQGTFYSGKHKNIIGDATIEWDCTGDKPQVNVYGNMTRNTERQINIDNLVFEVENTVYASAEKISFSSDTFIEIGDGYIDVSDATRSITLQTLIVEVPGVFNVELNGCLDITSGRNTTIYFGPDYVNISFSNGMTSIDLSDFYLDVNNGQFTVEMSHLSLQAENEMWVSFGEKLKASVSVDSLVVTECSISPSSNLFFMVNGSFDLSNAKNKLVVDFTDLENFEVELGVDGSVTLSDVVFVYDDKDAGKYVKLSWDYLDLSASGTATIEAINGEFTVDASGSADLAISDFLFYYDGVIPPLGVEGYTDISFSIPSFSVSISADIQDFTFALPTGGGEENSSGDGGDESGSGGGSAGSTPSLFVTLRGDFQLSGDIQVKVNASSFQSFDVNAVGDGDLLIGDFYLNAKDRTGTNSFVNSITVQIDFIEISGNGYLKFSEGLTVAAAGTISVNELYIHADTTVLTGLLECDYAYLSAGFYIDLSDSPMSISLDADVDISEFYASSGDAYVTWDLLTASGSGYISLGETTTISAGISYVEVENLIADTGTGIYAELSGIFNLQGSPFEVKTTGLNLTETTISLSGNPSIESFDLYVDASGIQVSLDWTLISAQGSGTVKIDEDQNVTISASFDTIYIVGLHASNGNSNGLTLSGSFQTSATIVLDLSKENKIIINGTGTISNLYFEVYNVGKITCSLIELNGDLEIKSSEKQLDITNIDATVSDLTVEIDETEFLSDVSGLLEGTLLYEWTGNFLSPDSVNLTGDILVTASGSGSIPLEIGAIELTGNANLDGGVYFKRISSSGWSLETAVNGIEISGTLQLADFKFASLYGEINIEGYAAFKKLSSTTELSFTDFSASGAIEFYLSSCKLLSVDGSLSASGDVTVDTANGYLETSSGFSISAGVGLTIELIDSVEVYGSLVLSEGSYIGWNIQSDTMTFTFEDLNTNIDLGINDVTLEAVSASSTTFTAITLCGSEGSVKVDGGFNFDVFKVTKNGEILFEALDIQISDIKITTFKNNENRKGFTLEKINEKDPVISGSLILFGVTYDTVTIASGSLRGSVTLYKEAGVFHLDGSSDTSCSLEVGTQNYHISADVGFSSGGGELETSSDFQSSPRYLECSVQGFEYYSLEAVLFGAGIKLQDGGPSGTFRIEWEEGLKNVHVERGQDLIPDFVYFTKPATDDWIQLWPIWGGNLQAFIEAPDWSNADEEISFHGAAIGGSGNYTFEWDFNSETDSGFQLDATGRDVTHTYSSDQGECQYHQVVLRVTDSNGDKVTAEHDINITSLKAHPNGPYSIEVGEDTILEGYAEDGCHEDRPATFTWSLYPNSEKNTYRFEGAPDTQNLGQLSAGLYTAKFTVSRFDGDKLVEQDIETTDLLVKGVQLEADLETAEPEQQITFTIHTYFNDSESFSGEIDYDDENTDEISGVGNKTITTTHNYDLDHTGERNVTVTINGDTDDVKVNVWSFNLDSGGPYHGRIYETIHFDGKIDHKGETTPSIEWTFGDGSPSSHVEDPEHVYNNTGDYIATFTVSIGDKTRSDTTKVFIVEEDYEPPTILHINAYSCFKASPNEKITVWVTTEEGDNPVDKYKWKLGDPDEGTWETTSTPSNKISNPRPGRCHSTWLNVKCYDTNGFSSDIRRAWLTWTRLDTDIDAPQSATDLVSVSFSADTTPPPVCNVYLGHSWIFGDGNGGSGADVEHRYGDDGVYFVKLETTSYNTGEEDRAYHTIRIHNVPPNSNFSINPLVTVVDEETYFDGNAEDLDGEIIGWKYDFDDGRRMYGYADYDYIYKNSGVYTPEFTTTDNDGDKDINKRDTITGVRDILVADAIVDDDFTSSTPKFGTRRFNSIQNAIDSPNVPNQDGLIVVLDGTYSEDVTVDKSIDLIAVQEGYKDSHDKISYGGVTIDGSADSSSTTVVDVTAPNVTMKHFNIMNDGTGVEINDNYANIHNCDISEADVGINMISSSNNSISSCDFSNNAKDVKMQSGSDDNTITSCTFSQIGNTRYGEGIKIINSKGNTIENCEIDDHNVGITMDNSMGNKVSNCEIDDNDKGILVKDSSNNVITYTNFSNNDYGVHLLNAEYTVIGAENAKFYFDHYDTHEPKLNHLSELSQGYTMKPTPSGGTPHGSPRPDNSYFDNNNYPIFIQNSEINAIKDCVINNPESDLISINSDGPSSTNDITIQNSNYILLYRNIVKGAKSYGVHIANSNDVTIWKCLIWENPTGIFIDHSSDSLVTMSTLLNHTTCGIYVSEESYTNVIRYNNIFRFGRTFYQNMINNGGTSASDWYQMLNDDRLTAYDAGVKTLWDDDGEYDSHTFDSVVDNDGAGNYWSDYNWEYYINNLAQNGTIVVPDREGMQMPEWIAFNPETGETIVPEPPQPDPHYEWLEIGDEPYNITGPTGPDHSQDRYPVFPYPFIWCKEWVNLRPDDSLPLPPESMPAKNLVPIE
ncbi:MAG: PKD domain-containing protein [Candidatus Thermoplasmatota archaeon]